MEVSPAKSLILQQYTVEVTFSFNQEFVTRQALHIYVKGGCRISKYFCWAAAPFYAKMASKLITILMPFFTSAVRP